MKICIDQLLKFAWSYSNLLEVTQIWLHFMETGNENIVVYYWTVQKSHSWFTIVSYLLLFTDFQFMGSLAFYWKVATITSIACVPLFIGKYLRKKFAPPAVAKLSWKLRLAFAAVRWHSHPPCYTSRWPSGRTATCSLKRRNSCRAFVIRNNNSRIRFWLLALRSFWMVLESVTWWPRSNQPKTKTGVCF